MDTYRASVGAILALITGRVVCTLDEMYALQDYLAGRPLMTHERVAPGAFEAHRGTLLAQFPRLAEAEFPSLPQGISPNHVRRACDAWVAEVAAHVGWTEADVARNPETDAIDPVVAANYVMDLMAKGRTS